MGLYPTFLFLLLLLLLVSAAGMRRSLAASNLVDLIYQGCSSQQLPPNSGLDQTLAALYSSLVAQSSQTRYFKTVSGSGDRSVSGLFQCRGDLSNGDCSDCVARLPDAANRVCGRVTAARVQLQGCYLQYTTGSSGMGDSGLAVLFTKCGSSQIGSNSVFLQSRDSAFSDVVTGIQGGSGFYTVDDGGVYALGQCEGDLGISDCGVCLKAAFREVVNRCGAANSGQAYLARCYGTYSYYPDGGSGGHAGWNSGGGGGGNGGGGGGGGGSGDGGGNTGKTVAIVMGGAAGLFFLFVCACFVRSLRKKHEDY